MRREYFVYMVSAAAIAVLVLLLLSPLIGLPQTVESEDLLVKAPELFVKAIFLYNQSTLTLEKSLSYNIDMSYVESLSKELISVYTDLSKLARGAYTGSELGDKIVRASASYAEISKASLYVLTASKELSKAIDDLDKAFSYALQCDFETSLLYWSKAKPHVIKAREELLEAFKRLTNVKESDLVSKKHREAYREGLDKVISTLKMLTEVLKTFEVIEKYTDVLEQLCKSYKCGCQANISQSQLGALSQALGELQPSNAGKYSYEVSFIKGLLKGAVGQQGSQGGQGSSSGSAGGGQGGGAGYGTPPSDD